MATTTNKSYSDSTRESNNARQNAESNANFARQDAGISQRTGGGGSGGSYFVDSSGNNIGAVTASNIEATNISEIQNAKLITERKEQEKADALKAQREAIEKAQEIITLTRAQADFYRQKNYTDDQIAYNVRNVTGNLNSQVFIPDSSKKTYNTPSDQRDKIIFNDSNEPVSIETDSLGGGRKSYSISRYNNEVERLNGVLPVSGFQNTVLNKFSDKKTGNNKFEQALNFKAYKNPQTGETFKTKEELSKYLKENRIPVSNEKQGLNSESLKEGDYFNYIESENRKTGSFLSRFKLESPVDSFNNSPFPLTKNGAVGILNPLIGASENTQTGREIDNFVKSKIKFILDRPIPIPIIPGLSIKTTKDLKNYLRKQEELASSRPDVIKIPFVKKITPKKLSQVIPETVGQGIVTSAEIASLYAFPGYAVPLIFSKPITETSNKVIDLIPGKGAVGQIARGGVLLASTPVTGPSYATELGKGLLINPVGTGKGLKDFAKQNPYEVATLLFGGGLKVDIKLPNIKLDSLKLDKNPQFGSFAKDIEGSLNIKEAIKLDEARFKVSYKFPKVIENIYTKAFSNFKPVETNVFGEQTIKGVEGTGKKAGKIISASNKGIGNPFAEDKVFREQITKTFDIGLIPESADVGLNINKALLNYDNLALKDNPKVVAKNNFEAEVLRVVKRNGDTIGGSFAGKILFEGARKPGDIDIVSRDPLKTAREIAKRNKNIKIDDHKVNGIQVVKLTDNLGHSADIVNIKGYKSVRKSFGFGDLNKIKVDGFNILRPEDLLFKRVETIEKQGLKYKKIDQTIKDIETYTKGDLSLDVNNPAIKGAFGFSKAELKAFVGKKGPVAHSSTGLFDLFTKESELKPAEQSGGFDVLFGTPFDIKTGKAQTRASRLGTDASIMDILTGDFTTKKPASKPQIEIFENQKIGFNTNKQQFGKDFNVLLKSGELEVGLPIFSEKGVPNVVRKVKSGGVAIINGGILKGTRVEINIVEVVKADSILDKATIDTIKKADKGLLSKQELESLNKKVLSKTGSERYSSSNKPYLDLDRIYSKAILANQKAFKDILNNSSSSGSRSSSRSSFPSLSSKSSQSSSSESIDSQISKAYSSLSNNASSSSNGSSSSGSSSSNIYNSYSGSSGRGSSSSIPSIPYYPYPEPKKFPKAIPFRREQKESVKRNNSGAGYNVFIKKLKTNSFVKANSYPLIEARAKDVGSYLVDNSLARTFVVKKTNLQAQPDFEFNYVPDGYFKLKQGKLRNFRVKNNNPYDFDTERYIERRNFSGDTRREINQLKAFQKQAQNALKF